MQRIKLVLFALVVAGLSLGIAACGDDEGDDGGGGGGEASLELTIGDSIPLSGSLAPYGPPGQKAADIAVSEVITPAIEEVGADHTVTTVTEDNCGGDDQQCAVQAARKLVDSDGATCLLGAWASADTLPTAESVAIPDEIPLISPASTRSDLTTLEDDGYMNRTAPGDNLQAEVLATVMDEELGGLDGKTVSIGARNDAYGTGFTDFLVPALEDLGATVNDPVIYDIDQPSYDSEADEITSGNADATVIIDFPEPFNKVGPALVRTGNYDASTTFITDGLIDSTLPDAAGVEVVDGLRGTAPGTPESGDAIEAFDKLFTSSEPANVKRQTFDAQNFDAAILCYLAAVAGGSTEGPDIRDNLAAVSGPPGDKFTFEQMADMITALQNGDDVDYEGASGPIDLDENGDPQAALYSVNQFNGDKLEPVGKPIPVGSLAE